MNTPTTFSSIILKYGHLEGFALISTATHHYIFLEPVRTWTGWEALQVTKILSEVEREVENTRVRHDGCTPLRPVPCVAGFLSYECLHAFETATLAQIPDSPVPLLQFFLYRTVIAVERSTNRHHIHGNLVPLAPLWESDEAEISHLLTLALSRSAPEKSLHAGDAMEPAALPLIEEEWRYWSNFSRKDFEIAVEAIKDAIRRGEVYQANLCQLLSRPLPTPPLEFAARLLSRQIATRGALLSLGIRSSTQTAVTGWSLILSDSPELFFEVIKSAPDERLIYCQPIKGTRGRGNNATEDRKARDELLQSSKDRAELAMIVDLLRNDLHRIAIPGSVKVESHAKVECYPTVHHLVSRISGRLSPEVTLPMTMRALFPCGSITGAPKIAAMNVIGQCELAPRGVFTGSIGMIAPGGLSHWNVAIRTATITGSTATIGVGSGITIDSEPSAEYEETLVKLRVFDSLWREPLEPGAKYHLPR